MREVDFQASADGMQSSSQVLQPQTAMMKRETLQVRAEAPCNGALEYCEPFVQIVTAGEGKEAPAGVPQGPGVHEEGHEVDGLSETGSNCVNEVRETFQVDGWMREVKYAGLEVSRQVYFTHI